MSILLALLLDWCFGEPPAKAHPVVLMGRYLHLAGQGLTRLPPRLAFWRGALFWCLGAGAFAGGTACWAGSWATYPPGWGCS